MAKVEIEADVPEGYRAVAWRPGKDGDYYMHRGKVNGPLDGRTACEFLIVEPVIKYRTPTAADVGSVVEVSDWQNFATSVRLKLLAVLPVGRKRFIAESDTEWVPYFFARIVDDGKTREPQPIEGWVNVYEKRTSTIHLTQNSANQSAGGDRLRCVRVREVIE